MKMFAMFLVFLAACFAAAATGVIAPPGEWYASLNKPTWNPPSWVFGPVWTTLYVMIAVAGVRVWRMRTEPGGKRAHGLWWLQIIFNAAWTPVFFALHQMGLALAVILILLILILSFIRVAWSIDKFSALLFAPYALWVSFASFLNFTLWRLN